MKLPEYRISGDGNEYSGMCLEQLMQRSEMDERIKQALLSSGRLPEYLAADTEAAEEIMKQLRVIKRTRGVCIEGVTAFPAGFAAGTLTAAQLRELSPKRRAAMLVSALKTVSELEREGVFPGPLYLGCIVADTGMRSDRVYLRAQCFQIGTLMYSCHIFEGDFLDLPEYPYFTTELQRTSNVRLAQRMLVTMSDNLSGGSIPSYITPELAAVLSAETPPSTEKLIDAVASCPFSDEKPAVRKREAAVDAVCFLVPPCCTAAAVDSVQRQISTVKTMLGAQRESAGVDEAFVFCRDGADAVHGGGNAGVIDFERMTPGRYPNAAYDFGGSGRDLRRPLLCAYVAAETAIRRYLARADRAGARVLLAVLLNENTDASLLESFIIRFAGEYRDRVDIALLYTAGSRGAIPDYVGERIVFATDGFEGCRRLEKFLKAKDN